jgi:hypothetical protein
MSAMPEFCCTSSVVDATDSVKLLAFALPITS